MRFTIEITHDAYVNVYDWRVTMDNDVIREGDCAPADLKNAIRECAEDLAGYARIENRA